MAEKKRTAEFLNKVYQNAQMASDSITTVSQKVKDEKLLSDLQTQHQKYSEISSKATTELANSNELPDENSIMEKAMTWSGIQMNTAFDKSPDKIAEMMIQGSVMGIIDMTRTLKQYNDIPQDIKSLGYELIKLEENNMQRMKNYLG